jgi:hypothetical protein
MGMLANINMDHTCPWIIHELVGGLEQLVLLYCNCMGCWVKQKMETRAFWNWSDGRRDQWSKGRVNSSDGRRDQWSTG